MKKLLFLLLPAIGFSQVGIQTQTFLPGEIFRVAGGTVTYENIPPVTTAQYVMVTDSEGRQMKLLLSSLLSIPQTCPNFIKNESNGYYLKFSSASSIPNPNNSLSINGILFVQSGSWIANNTYFYSWSNFTGTPLNINNFTVNFGNQICTYN